MMRQGGYGGGVARPRGTRPFVWTPFIEGE